MSIKATMGILGAGVLAAAPVLAGHNRDRAYPEYVETGYDYAQVVDVEPLVRQVRVVVPRQECYVESRYEPAYQVHGREQPAAGPMILGGLIGAVIGNQIGHRETRRTAAIAGAVIGTAIGHDAALRRVQPADYADVPMRPVESRRCEVREVEHFEERIEGYRVTYRYNDQLYTAQMPSEPGERIRVRVSVDPLSYQ